MDNTNQAFDPEDAGVSEEKTAEILDVVPGTLATWRSQGKGPKFRKIGRRIEYTPRTRLLADSSTSMSSPGTPNSTIC